MSKDKPQKAETLQEKIRRISAKKLGVVSSPSTTLEIMLDIRKESEKKRVLGQMVFVQLEEDGQPILSLGQIVEVVTKNRWHEDPSFKGVIKHHGRLPHLSGVSDNRTAKISVQSSFDLGHPKPSMYLLGMSPSTGISVEIVNNSLMDILVEHHRAAITYLGKVYGTDVDLPMWFKHFGEDKNIPALGAKDAYHIGVFGKTGSGKSVTSALMLLAYAKNNKCMNILVLDPQGQFYSGRELLPRYQSSTSNPGDTENQLSAEVKRIGMKFEKYKLTKDVSLPDTDIELFVYLLKSNGFIQQAFGKFYTEDKIDRMCEVITGYIEGRTNSPGFRLRRAEPEKLLLDMCKRFLSTKEGEKGYSKYITNVFGTEPTQKKLYDRITSFRNKMEDVSHGDKMEDVSYAQCLRKWQQTLEMFSESRGMTIDKICKKVTGNDRGNFIVLDLSPQPGEIENDNLQALFLRLIEKGIVKSGGHLYAQGERANCLIVMDEAHRFVARNSPDDRVKSLTRDIVDAVRTTRKFGIGHMFITQSLESLDDEIIKQTRIFAFGHGLTMGSELRKIRDIINNQAAVNLYASFIDPGNREKFPFMFFWTGIAFFSNWFTSFS